MKYLIVIGDGMADYPIGELGDKTPLMAADKPNMDDLARKGRCGLFKTIPEGTSAGSEVANLSILGYNPAQCLEGRGVLEAASMGIKIADDELVFRCNLICVQNGNIKTHSAGHITSEEAAVLIKELNARLGSNQVKFYPGVSYRHILILKGQGFSREVKCVPPHDVLGSAMEGLMPAGEEKTRSLLHELIHQSNNILENHPVNIARAGKGQDQANYIWPWSPGRKPKMEKFLDKFGKNGAVISAVDLLQGIGIYIGFDVVKVPGATGLYDTNYEGKAQAAVEALRGHDLVYCHVEASDEAGHQGDFLLKKTTIEYLDKRLLGNIMRILGQEPGLKGNVSVAVLPDHFTPCRVKGHTAEPVPFLIYNPRLKADAVVTFDEQSCQNGSLGLLHADQFIKKLLEVD